MLVAQRSNQLNMHWEYNPAMPRIFLERRDMGEELRRLFDLLEGEDQASPTQGQCNPPVDVVESHDAVEVIIDLPAVTHDQVHVVFARGTLLVAGIKQPKACGHTEAAFHLAERAFGRFARAIPLAGAVDAGRARATLTAGELRVVIPRIAERRGSEIRVAIETA